MTMPTDPPIVVLRSILEDELRPWLEFTDPVDVLQTDDSSRVVPLLEKAEKASREGLYAAGFVTYEAASAFDPALSTREPGSLPLVWFGIFRRVLRRSSPPFPNEDESRERVWQPSIDREDYRRAIRAIRSAIARGDTYQANFSFRLRSAFTGDAPTLFVRLAEAQPAAHAAYLDIGEHAICSVSPELFFCLDGSRVTCRPMKGTARRGLTRTDDRRLALSLWKSRKDRAENLMIVDMIRNDLGRIADPGTVSVTSLFELETYSSVHQLTSEVRATSSRSAVEILTALFPCASITGAPKIETMRLLSSLEQDPRGVYTGTIGYFAPLRRAEFNVAIRTLHVDRAFGTAEFGTGGGIVWDSDPDAEYSECATKASILTIERPEFELLETVRCDPSGELFLLDRHLRRLRDSAAHFGFRYDRSTVEESLRQATRSQVASPRRLRILLAESGAVRIQDDGPVLPASQPWRLAISPEPIRSDNVFLYHKTTAREIYRSARAAAPGHDDVLLWNESGRITESTIANVVAELDGRRVTPPSSDGLLAGTMRQDLLSKGVIDIAPLDFSDLARASRLWLINSVSEWIEVSHIDDSRPGHDSPLWRNTRP